MVVVDLPGAYSMSPFTSEESITSGYVKNENPDFMCVQETKMQEGQANIELDGYYQYWNSADKKVIIVLRMTKQVVAMQEWIFEIPNPHP